MKFLLLFFLLISTAAFGQTSAEQRTKIDSLKKIIASAKNDTVVINAMKAWDDIVYRSEPNTDLKLNRAIDSISTFRLGTKTSEKERDFYLRSKGYSTGNLGFINNSHGENKKAIAYYNESLKYKLARKDLKGAARAYSNIGSVYHEQGIYNTALQYYTKALELHKKADDKKGTAGALNNIAIIHRTLENYESALKFYNESLEIKNEIADSNAIAIAYLNIGTLYEEMKQYDLARTTTLKSLQISKAIGDKSNEAIGYVNLGEIFQAQKQWSSALTEYFKGLEIQRSIKDNKKTAETTVYIGEVYLLQGKIQDAKNYGEMALNMSREFDVISVSEKATKILSQAYKKLGNTQKALEMLELNLALNDSIASIENQKAAISQEYKYAYDKQAAADSIQAAEAKKLHDAQLAAEIAKKKQLRLKTQQQEQQKYYLFGLLALTLVFAGFIFNRFRHARKQQKIIEFQKEQVYSAYIELDSEKKKSDELLLNILPEEVAEELKTDGTSTPKHYDQVTVLFTDFRGFTNIAAATAPQELVETLNDCFSHFDTIIERHNLEKIKTIGDAYMCAGGVPVENTTNAKDAVNAAAEMVEWVNAWNEKRRSNGLPVLEIRIGIHTGELVAGVIGFKKFAYDVWGDAVNVASRMESSGEPGKVNISAATYELVKDDFETEYRGELEVKNRGLIGMYFVG